MAAVNSFMTSARQRAYLMVLDNCQRAAPHLRALQLAGVPAEQEEARIRHLIQACEGILELGEQQAQEGGK